MRVASTLSTRLGTFRVSHSVWISSRAQAAPCRPPKAPTGRFNDWFPNHASKCLDMQPIQQFQALVRADAREVAERSLRHKFGRLSNIRILNVLRPAAEKVDEFRALSDSNLLDLWFAEFNRLRSEMRLGSRELKTQSSAN
jgi:hypothetical protein